MKSLAAALLITPLLVSLAPSAPAQGLPENEQKIYDKVLAAAELNDVKEISKVVEQYHEECAHIYAVLEIRALPCEAEEDWNEVKLLGRALDEVEQGNVYALRFKTVYGLGVEARRERRDSMTRLSDLNAKVRSARSDPTQTEVLNEGLTQLQELAAVFEKLGDAQHQAYCLGIVADALAQNQQADAFKLFDQVDGILKAAGYRGFKFHEDVAKARDDLRARGFDPASKPAEGEGDTNSGTSWSPDPEGQKYSDPVQLRCVIEKKALVETYVTPSIYSGERTAQWHAWGLDGNGPQAFDARFKPFGKAMQVTRDGMRIFVQLEGAKKPQEIKVISQPNVVEVETEYADWEGNKKKLEYGWLAASGGPDEMLFGTPVNSSPNADHFGIRYASNCYLKGKVLGHDIMVFDDNSSGRFGDPDTLRDSTTALTPEYMDNDAMIIDGGKVAGPWTEYLEVDGAFYRLKLSPEDYTIRTRKLAVDTGKVAMKFHAAAGAKEEPQIVIIQEIRNFVGAYFAIGKKPVTVPVGLYRLSYGIIRYGTKKSQLSCMILPGKSVAFPVKKDQQEVIELGEPFTFDFETQRIAGGAVKIPGNTVVVYGRAGELYTHFYDVPAIPEKVTMRLRDGAVVGKPQAMAQPTFDDYKANPVCVWQPLDMILAGETDKVYQVRMELKKHVMLGGPIKSEWK
ncbi:MAG: hypothetical protein HY812_04575 [Planctomycetes bacterium]|nr:hypothetical protein [Planctomycetota bacterium]